MSWKNKFLKIAKCVYEIWFCFLWMMNLFCFHYMYLGQWPDYPDLWDSSSDLLPADLYNTWTAHVVCWTHWYRKVRHHQQLPADSPQRCVSNDKVNCTYFCKKFLFLREKKRVIMPPSPRIKKMHLYTKKFKQWKLLKKGNFKYKYFDG